MDTEVKAPQQDRGAETRGEIRQEPTNPPGKWSNAAKSRHLRIREVALKASGLGQEDGSWRDRVAISTQRVGDRLRSIRRQKGLSLHEVEAMSNEEFKASVLGAYERGERSISVPRLQRLARFYGVPVDQLLPRDADDEAAGDSHSPGASPGKVRIDLVRLLETEGPECTVLQRYVSMVQMQRGDFNGRVLTIRSDDLRALASVLEQSPEVLLGRLEGLGVKAAIVH
jgi:transcriptional regulator with XRE-family HTH domain